MKLGICIPYRNRQEHLEKLVPHLSGYLNEKGIEHKFYVGHQVDNNLFNRGMMKNIAAKFAFDDGCDYVAWHDVDMLPQDMVSPDYSYPENNPIHIATKLSKYNYGINYDQYFGGVVLFTKEQVERTNGYSNEYWDWGQEDDDLFWRCYFENYTTGKIYKTIPNKRVAYFNGEDSSIIIPSNRENNTCLHNDHTITITFNAEQQGEKVPIWLVGDKNKRFIEYPILRKDGSGTWGISFNNSRAVTATLFDRSNQFNYNWAKRFENLWTQVTMSYNSDEKNMYFYVNNELIAQIDGIKQNIPFPISGDLRSHASIKPFLIGMCGQTNTRYKGKIADVKIYDTFFKDISEMENNTDNLVLDCNFTNEIGGNINNVVFETEDIEIIENIIPYRREGSFVCLHHEDEGFVNGGWVKGETTAKNEKRFVTEMQQRKIDYKNDGYLQVMDKLIIQNVEENPYNCLNTILINVTT